MSRRKLKEALAIALAGIPVLIVIGLLIWISTHIPCAWFQFAKAAEVPARCLTNFKH
ncbi:hypothetical protein [Kribbella italica]|uniref:Uncharacterized protein n=1 Tax=Kribbella italica TaxID=1540520 RepID=A0A7W9J0H3_9ACTN|nr:hypothetical protein [Kribbella italica]MBB5833396.1 hypothetical protein [Kribbella italica]